jgi:hypothetical protein
LEAGPVSFFRPPLPCPPGEALLEIPIIHAIFIPMAEKIKYCGTVISNSQFSQDERKITTNGPGPPISRKKQEAVNATFLILKLSGIIGPILALKRKMP